ncbi:MAG: hypothetical protein IPK03_03230 [Bacteroidetes bacterium]|nr:hypothetical protein [Bacteroidota bacterium]
MLVKAVAGGLDINSVVMNLNAPMPHYRFVYILQKAKEFNNELKGFGNSILAALEKKDAEELSLLRSLQELNVLNASIAIKDYQINESVETINSLKIGKEIAEEKLNYYSSMEFMNSAEKNAFSLNSSARSLSLIMGLYKI